jgi:hypothetical protein
MVLPIMGGQEKERHEDNNLEVFNLVDVDVLELFLHLLHAHLHGVHRALRILNRNTILKSVRKNSYFKNYVRDYQQVILEVCV